jgi:YD repeat-containing protein
VAQDGGEYYEEPPGVHLYLRRASLTDPQKAWAFTRPDRVTFFYDAQGWPTTVEDRNGNRLLFTSEPYGGGRRITAVTDAAGAGPSDLARTFRIEYYALTDGVTAPVVGKVKRVVDHTDPQGGDRGTAIVFQYYEDGTLRQLVEESGVRADGSFLPSRSFVFRYTTVAGVKRVLSLDDPRFDTSQFTYDSTTARLGSRLDRGGYTTVYTYDPANRVSTVQRPVDTNPRRYTFTPGGQVTKIENQLDQPTEVRWDADRHVTRVVEPTGAYEEYRYDDNGYLTDQWDQLRNRTQLE